ncbi:MAG: hypothetical protein U0792_05255 [Gemmataceae bacterium]
MERVLNGPLYKRLQKLFGAVKVTRRGVPMQASRSTDYLTGEPRLQISEKGEQYHVSCPFCGDTRFRLYIHHTWGQRDVFGRRVNYLAHCHNEDCLSKAENRQKLTQSLAGVEGLITPVARASRVRLSDPTKEYALPGSVTRVDELPPEHIARQYLTGRKFDPDKLARIYGVSYCEESVHYLARKRIIIPVLEGGKRRGWQARFVGELDWKGPNKSALPPKYFTASGMPRSELLYNLDQARKYSTGVIVEGVTDVWSFGPMAVGLFGKNMTDEQRRKFLATFRERTAVLLLDPEEFDTECTQEMIRQLRRAMPKSFAAVKLPDGSDPGSLDRSFLRAYVAEQAADQGVTVTYRKVV